MFTVYILFSKSTQKFYVGFTCDLEDRLTRHNDLRSKSTKSGTPWVLVYTEHFESSPKAKTREKQIKNWKLIGRTKPFGYDDKSRIVDYWACQMKLSRHLRFFRFEFKYYSSPRGSVL